MVEQPKQWLCGALINLVTKENFQDIPTAETAQIVELSRKTFHHSFKNKEAVINYLCDQLFGQYLEQLFQQRPQVGEVMLKTTFDTFLNFWWQKRDLIQLLIRQGLFDYMNEIRQQKTILRHQWFAAPWHAQGTPTQANYVMTLQPDGPTNTLHAWLGQGNPESPEQTKDAMLLAARQLADSLNANQT